MPDIRVAWAPSARHMFWAAVSNADRTPSALDASIRANIGGFTGPGGIPVLIRLTGNPKVKNEDLIAYEVGYRTMVLKQLSIDFTGYYNNYSNQNTTEPMALFAENSPSPPHLVLPLVFENLMHGETHGVEIAVNWQPIHRWTLSPGYAFEQIHMQSGSRESRHDFGRRSGGKQPRSIGAASIAFGSRARAELGYFRIFREPPHRPDRSFLYQT